MQHSLVGWPAVEPALEAVRREWRHDLARICCRQEGLHLCLEIVAQVLPLVTFARRLSPFWIAFIDNVAGQFAFMKGYGKDLWVNGILASFWGLAADRQWSPDFHRVPSASNVSDAISRGDGSRARAEGWTRVATPVDDIMDVLGMQGRLGHRLRLPCGT